MLLSDNLLSWYTPRSHIPRYCLSTLRLRRKYMVYLAARVKWRADGMYNTEWITPTGRHHEKTRPGRANQYDLSIPS